MLEPVARLASRRVWRRDPSSPSGLGGGIRVCHGAGADAVDDRPRPALRQSGPRRRGLAQDLLAVPVVAGIADRSREARRVLHETYLVEVLNGRAVPLPDQLGALAPPARAQPVRGHPRPKGPPRSSTASWWGRRTIRRSRPPESP